MRRGPKSSVPIPVAERGLSKIERERVEIEIGKS